MTGRRVTTSIRIISCIRVITAAVITTTVMALPPRSLLARETREIPCFAPEAAERWKPLDGSGRVEVSAERTPDGGPALRLPCEMSRLSERAYWDLPIPASSGKLSTATRVALWIKAKGDPSAIASGTIYFRSGKGWYAEPCPVGLGEWTRVVLPRVDFRPEGEPGGWGAIDLVRVSFWKGGEGEAEVLLGGMKAELADVVVVRSARGGAGTQGRETASVAAGMLEILEESGISAAPIDDAEVERSGLAGAKVAIFPHNPEPTEKELDRVDGFVAEGGRILVCYGLHPRIARLLGLTLDGYLRSERRGAFASIRALPGAPAGFPKEARQESWNIFRVRPTVTSEAKPSEEEAARVVARWFDSEGKDTGHAAVILAEKGAYVSHVLLRDDPANKARLLRALLGRLRTEVWDETVGDARERAGRVSSWETAEAAEAGVRKLALEAGGEGSRRARAVGEILERAKSLRASAERAAGEKRHDEALDGFSEARRTLLDAFVRAQPSRSGEFRAVWCHSAYGVAGESWDESIRRLKESGFNAIVPNMLWGGVADYPSEILPVRERVAKDGDQIALCVAAGKKHGVEVHVWKVDWNLSGAPGSFVEGIRKGGRLQVSSRGEEVLWLCPSHPDNFALERDSLLEVVRKYDVGGIHFDYIRYPDASSCYCEGCRARFEKESANPVAAWPQDVLRGGERHAAYQEFRRQRITRLVRTVSEEARRLKPRIQVSAAVFSTWPACREDIGQDWVAWAKEGLLDFVCPMNYTYSVGDFRRRLRVELDAVGGAIPVYSGVGASAPGLSLDQVIDQVQEARGLGARGFIIFNYSGAVAKEYVPALGLGTTAGSATAPP
jgi:uncharacterized lipoprotein YddW (UPF0748 family)